MSICEPWLMSIPASKGGAGILLMAKKDSRPGPHSGGFAEENESHEETGQVYPPSAAPEATRAGMTNNKHEYRLYT